jgi:hypothetical protein
MALKLEHIKQLLRLLLASHHRATSRIGKCATIESRGQRPFNGEFFNGIQEKRTPKNFSRRLDCSLPVYGPIRLE